METIISNQKLQEDASAVAAAGFDWREKNGVKGLVCKELEAAGFANAFSTRLGGVSDFPENDLNLAGFGEDTDQNIQENRLRFLRLFDPGFRLTSVWQVHGNSIKPVNTESDVSGTEDKHDAMVSSMPGVLLGVKTADCVPVLIGDPVRKSFASVHAGWRGTVSSIVRLAVEALWNEYGSRPEDLICAIGPAAGCESYEIGQEVIDEFTQKFAKSDHLFDHTRPGHALIDLHTANREQLVDAGVVPEKISVAPLCTMQRTDLFFSYRVEKRKYGRTGRLMSVIGLKN